MRKKKQNPNLSLADYLSQYDQKSLIVAAGSIGDGFGWNLLTAFIKLRQREFEIAALDLVRKNSMTQDAAFASGYAQGMSDLVDKFIPDLITMVQGNQGVIENPMPEEVNELNGE